MLTLILVSIKVTYFLCVLNVTTEYHNFSCFLFLLLFLKVRNLSNCLLTCKPEKEVISYVK